MRSAPTRSADYVTVGGCHTRSNVHPYMPDMSWLGDPPTKAIAKRYEVARVTRHLAAVATDDADRDREIVVAAKSFIETPEQRRRRNKRINELAARTCGCKLCGGTP